MKKIAMLLMIGFFIAAGVTTTSTGCRAKKPSAKIASGFKKSAKKQGKRFTRMVKREEKKRH